MKKTLLITTILVFIFSAISMAQKVQFTGDSTKLRGGATGYNELIINNSTSTVPGFLYNAGNGKTVFVSKVVNTMSDLNTIALSPAESPLLQAEYLVKGYYNANDGAGGRFILIDTTGAAAVPGMVIPVGSTKAYVRDRDKSDNVNPAWWGLVAADTTIDNAPAINAAISYAAIVGAKVVLNSNKNYTVKTGIVGVKGATFELGYADTLTAQTDGISVITIPQGFKCTLNGLINLKSKVATAVTMDGRSSFGLQNYNSADYVFNVKGAAPLVLGQVAVRMMDTGNDTANSTRTSYIKFIHIKAIAVDTILTIRATRKANTNNCWFDFMCLNTINGIYIETDTARGSIFAGNRLTGIITASDWTQRMLYMGGTSVRENIVDMKYEDVERHELSKKDLPVWVGPGTTGNWFRLRGIETDNVYDAGWMNIFDMKDVGNDPALTQNSTLGVLPTGGFDRPQGDLSDIFLGIDKKPGFITVTTTSGSVSGNIKNMFDLDGDAVESAGQPSNYSIADAVSSDQVILIGLKSPVRNPKDFIISFAPGMGVKRCMVEGYSVDSLKWFPIRDYDSLTGINRELIFNMSQVISTAVLKCTNVPNGSDTVCKWGYNRIPFKNLDSLKITIRANDQNPVSGIVQIRKMSLTAYGTDANSYAKSTGGDLYGTWNFKNAAVDSVTATGPWDFSSAQVVGLPGGGVTQGHLADFNMFLGANQGAYNVDNTTTGPRPAGFTIGEMWFSNSRNAGDWDSIQPASQILAGTNGPAQNLLFIRSFSGGTWSAWTTVGAGGSGTVTSVATTANTGLKGGTITTAGTLYIDTTIIATRAWRDKLADSINVTKTKVITSYTTSINGTIAAASTQYSSIGSSNFANLEATKGMVITDAGIIRNFYITTRLSQPATGTLTLTIRKNGSDTPLQIVVPAGASAGVFSDITHSASASPGDVFTFSATNSSATDVSCAVVAVSFGVYKN